MRKIIFSISALGILVIPFMASANYYDYSDRYYRDVRGGVLECVDFRYTPNPQKTLCILKPRYIKPWYNRRGQLPITGDVSKCESGAVITSDKSTCMNVSTVYTKYNRYNQHYRHDDCSRFGCFRYR